MLSLNKYWWMKKELGVNGLVINLRREKGDEYI